jgi:hypothetical protein
MISSSCLVGLVGLGVCPIRDETLPAGEWPGKRSRRDEEPLFRLFDLCYSAAVDHEVQWSGLPFRLSQLFDFVHCFSVSNHGCIS